MGAATDIITDARAFASTTLGSAQGALSDSQAAVANIGGAAIITGVSVQLPALPDEFEPLVPPNLIDVEFSPPATPDTTVTGEIVLPEIAIPAVPLRGDITKPTITLPDKPGQLAAFTAQLPNIDLDLQFPTVPPEFTDPRAAIPTVQDRPEPDKPTILLPVFDALVPVDTTVAPTNLEKTFTDAYRDISPVMMAELEGQMDAYLISINPRYHEQLAGIEDCLATYKAGGTALPVAVENALFERGRDKTNAETRRTQDAAFDSAAKRGFSMPDISTMAAVQRARQEGGDNNARAGMEIAIKQAELEQANMQFAITTSVALRNAALQASLTYHGNLVTVNGQAVSFANNVLSAVVQLFNLNLQAFASRLEVYKAEANVYDTKLRATLSTIEIYKAEIAAFSALTDVDIAKINAHRIQTDILNALASVYRTQIEGVLGEARLEAAKVDVFKSQVDAFSSQVSAKNSEWQGYSAEISGEESKVRLFATEVDAFNAEMRTFATEVDAKATIVNTIADWNKNQVEKVRLNVDVYSALVDSLSTVSTARLNNQQQELTNFQIQTSAEIQGSQIQLDRFRSIADVRLKETELAVVGISRSADTEVSANAAIAAAFNANGLAFADVAGAALAGMSSIATINEEA